MTGTRLEHGRSTSGTIQQNNHITQIGYKQIWPEHDQNISKQRCKTNVIPPISKKTHDQNMAGTRPRALQKKHYRNIVMQMMDKTTRHDWLIIRTHQNRTPEQNQIGSLLIWGHKWQERDCKKCHANRTENNITGTCPEHNRNTAGTWPEHLRKNAAK